MRSAEPWLDSSWRARLSLGYELEDGHTRLKSRGHEGPLLVQRPFYPEGPALCQTIVVHPPGGIAGGDTLELSAAIGKRAQAQFTTPGATKWYRGFARTASQHVHIEVGAGGLCEWLPQENIVYDGAQAATSLEADLEEGATWCSWDFTCLGRPESAAPFESGRLRQRVMLRRRGQPLFREQALLEGGSELLASRAVLDGRNAYGALIVAGPAAPPALVERAREIVNACATAGVSSMGALLVARWVGERVEEGRSLFTSLWAVLRPWYAQRMAVIPRIWNT
ncbi:MAG: urease accessory protein UreD [Burkholderiales bacterium]